MKFIISHLKQSQQSSERFGAILSELPVRATSNPHTSLSSDGPAHNELTATGCNWQSLDLGRPFDPS